MSGSRHSRLYRKLRPGHAPKGGSEAAGAAEWQYHSRQAGTPPQGDQPEDWRAPSRDVSKRPWGIEGIRPDGAHGFFVTIGGSLHAHSRVALRRGELEVVLRGCGANFHGDVPEVVWYLAWCSTVSRPRSLLSFPVVAPALVSHNCVRSAGLMDTAYVGVKPTDGSRSLMSLFSPPKASRVVTSGTRPHLYTGETLSRPRECTFWQRTQTWPSRVCRLSLS